MQSQNKVEFFTLDTCITIQRGNLYHKKVKQESELGQYRFIVFAVYCLVVFLTVVEIKEEGNYYEIIKVAVFSILVSSIFKSIFQTLFIKTWKTIIPLKDVKNITTKPLDNGLETEVTLHLQNGRKKFYTFRNAEGQLEAFVEALEMHTTATASAAV